MGYTSDVLTTVVVYLTIFGLAVAKTSTVSQDRGSHHSAGSISCAFQYLRSELRHGYYVMLDGDCQLRDSAINAVGTNKFNDTIEVWNMIKKSTQSSNQYSYIFKSFGVGIKNVKPLCPIPRDSDISTVRYTSLLPGSKAVYSCSDEFSGYCDGQSSKTVQCLSNGRWESLNDSCTQLVWVNPKVNKDYVFVVIPRCHMKVGFSVYLSGRAMKVVGINIHHGQQVLFHMVAYLKGVSLSVLSKNKRRITFNSKLKDKWGSEIMEEKFDIWIGKDFNITVKATEKGFDVYINGRKNKHYAHRTPFLFIDKIVITGPKTKLKRLQLIP